MDKEQKIKNNHVGTAGSGCSKGISLISLIITIIILLILATITVDFVNDGKVMDSAKKTKNEMENQLEQQHEMVNDVRNLYK